MKGLRSPKDNTIKPINEAEALVPAAIQSESEIDVVHGAAMNTPSTLNPKPLPRTTAKRQANNTHHTKQNKNLKI